MTAHATAELPRHLAAALPADGFRRSGILVIGDLMLDRYLIGEVNRISPEAPVPVVAVKQQRGNAGGAGNVALNIAGLHARAIVAGVVGDDSAGRSLLGILSAQNIDLSGVLIDRTRRTTRKTRVMCGSHQIVRLDDENSADLQPSVSAELLRLIIAALNEGVDAVILSDYAKGVLSESLTRAIILECSTRGIPVFIDPKRADYSPYSQATCITPNHKEFQAALIAMAIPAQDQAAAGRLLLERLGCRTLLITQGANGMTFVTPDQFRHFPALAEEVFDVSGAGDTVIATLAAAKASGLDFPLAVELANFAASVVVRRVGTSPVVWEDLIAPGTEIHGSAGHMRLPMSPGRAHSESAGA